MNNPTLRNKSVFDAMRSKIYLSKKSFSYINGALDDLVTREIEPFSWRVSDVYKSTLNIYSDFIAKRKRGGRKTRGRKVRSL